MFILFPFVTLDNFTPLPRRQWTGSWELSVATVRGGFSTGKAEEKEICIILVFLNTLLPSFHLLASF